LELKETQKKQLLHQKLVKKKPDKTQEKALLFN